MENRPGANSAIGIQAVINSKPDGYTFMILPASIIVANPLTNKEIKYNALTDLAPAAPLFGATSAAVAVDGKSQIQSLKQLSDHLRAKQTVRFPAATTTALAISNMYLKAIGVRDIVRVNYRSNPDAMSDLVAGNLDFITSDMIFGASQAKAGKLRLLATSGPSRSEAAKDVPNLAEEGYPDLVFEAVWMAFFPQGTPDETLNKMAGWFNQIMKLPETKQFLSNIGADAFFADGDSTRAKEMLQKEAAKWDAVSRTIDLTQQ